MERERPGGLSNFRRNWFTVPLRIAEVIVRLHEIVDGEVILPVIEPRAAPDDLLELDHGIHRPHEHDVADIARVHAGRELLRGGEDGGNALLVVLKIAQVLLAERAVVGRDPLAVIRIATGLHLVDEVAHGQGGPAWRRRPTSFRSGSSVPAALSPGALRAP